MKRAWTFLKRQHERIPAWIRQTLWSVLLLWCVVDSAVEGRPLLAALLAFVAGLDLDQYFHTRLLNNYNSICDEYVGLCDKWSEDYKRLTEDNERLSAALCGALQAKTPEEKLAVINSLYPQGSE